MPTYYQILGVNKKTTRVQIKKAYAKHALEQHPDRGGSGEAFHLIGEAFNVLSNESLKKQYDKHGAPDCANAAWQRTLQEFNAADIKAHQQRTERDYLRKQEESTVRSNTPPHSAKSSRRRHSSRHSDDAQQKQEEAERKAKQEAERKKREAKEKAEKVEREAKAKEAEHARRKSVTLKAQAAWDQQTGIAAEFRENAGIIFQGVALMFDGTDALKGFSVRCGDYTHDQEVALKEAFMQSFQEDGSLLIKVSSPFFSLRGRAGQIFRQLFPNFTSSRLHQPAIKFDETGRATHGLSSGQYNFPLASHFAPFFSATIVSPQRFAQLVDPVSIAMQKMTEGDELSKLLTVLLNIDEEHPDGVPCLAYGDNYTFVFSPENDDCISRLLANRHFQALSEHERLIRTFSALLADLKIKQQELKQTTNTDEVQRLSQEISDCKAALNNFTTPNGRARLKDPVLWSIVDQGGDLRALLPLLSVYNEEQIYGKNQQDMLARLLTGLANIDEKHASGVIAFDYGEKDQSIFCNKYEPPIFSPTSPQSVEKLLKSKRYSKLSKRCKEVTTGLCLMLTAIKQTKSDIANTTDLSPRERDMLTRLVHEEETHVHTFMRDASKVNSDRERKSFAGESRHRLSKITQKVPVERLSGVRIFLTALSLLTGIAVVALPAVALSSSRGIRAAFFSRVDTTAVQSGLTCAQEHAQMVSGTDDEPGGQRTPSAMPA